MGILEGKVAVITGANEIAQGVATRFAREGCRVILIAPDEAAASRITEPGQVVAADLGNAAATAHAIDGIARAEGGIDILVNATQPATGWAAFIEKDAADYRTAYENVVLPAVHAMKAAHAHLKAREGRVINIGSMYGIASHRDVTDAIAVDGALIALTRGVGLEWGRDQINVNYLQAAAPDIEVFRAFQKEKGQGVADLIELLPLGRMADPVEDIGGGALFLASDESCFIVGHKVLADGGQHLAAPVFEPGGQF